ncbi:hypothetical protein KJ637_05530 [Patescibacteria group bacterium]|nr:hypothetical protein [Patescibacteria group bacterium]
MSTKKFRTISILFILAILVTGCQNPQAKKAGVWYAPWTWGDHTLEESLETGCAGGATSTIIKGSTYPCPATEEPADSEAPVAPPDVPLAPTAVPEEPAEELPNDESTICQGEGMWSAAGEAPQTLDEAAEILGVNDSIKRYMTPLYPEPGDDTVIGWVIGTKATESEGRTFSANIPACTTVDYDPDVSELTGNSHWTVEFTPDWQRALMAQNGELASIKITVYWTPGDPGDGTIVSE